MIGVVLSLVVSYGKVVTDRLVRLELLIGGAESLCKLLDAWLWVFRGDLNRLVAPSLDDRHKRVVTAQTCLIFLLHLLCICIGRSFHFLLVGSIAVIAIRLVLTTGQQQHSRCNDHQSQFYFSHKPLSRNTTFRLVNKLMRNKMLFWLLLCQKCHLLLCG